MPAKRLHVTNTSGRRIGIGPAPKREIGPDGKQRLRTDREEGDDRVFRFDSKHDDQIDVIAKATGQKIPRVGRDHVLTKHHSSVLRGLGDDFLGRLGLEVREV